MAVDNSWITSLKGVESQIKEGKLDYALTLMENHSAFYGDHPSAGLSKIYIQLGLYYANLEKTKKALKGNNGGIVSSIFGSSGPNQKEALAAINDALIALQQIGKEIKSAVARERV